MRTQPRCRGRARSFGWVQLRPCPLFQAVFGLVGGSRSPASRSFVLTLRGAGMRHTFPTTARTKDTVTEGGGETQLVPIRPISQGAGGPGKEASILKAWVPRAGSRASSTEPGLRKGAASPCPGLSFLPGQHRARQRAHRRWQGKFDSLSAYQLT